MKPTREHVRIAAGFSEPITWGFVTPDQKDSVAQALGLNSFPGDRIFLIHCQNVITAATFGDDMPTIADAMSHWERMREIIGAGKVER